MRKTAGFLRGCCTFAIVLAGFGTVMMAIGFVAIAFAGSFSELAAKADSAITISGGTMTPAEMDALKPVILGALGASLASMVLTIFGAVKTRDALTECREERPFSQKCADSLKTSARIEIIAGLVGIAVAAVLSFMAANLTVNGAKLGGSGGTFSLSFIFYAVLKYLFYHIVSYGHTLERDPRRL